MLAFIFYHKRRIKYIGVMLKGKMKVLTDQQSKKQMRKRGSTISYKKDVTDPDYYILNCTARTGHYYCNLKTSDFKIN